MKVIELVKLYYKRLVKKVIANKLNNFEKTDKNNKEREDRQPV